MRNIVILNSLHFSYPLPILMRVSYNTLIVKQNTSDYYKYNEKRLPGKVHSPKYLYIGMLLQGIKYQYLESQTYPFPRV